MKNIQAGVVVVIVKAEGDRIAELYEINMEKNKLYKDFPEFIEWCLFNKEDYLITYNNMFFMKITSWLNKLFKLGMLTETLEVPERK